VAARSALASVPVAHAHHHHRSSAAAGEAVIPAVAGGPQVQFGALASRTEARAEWARLKDKMPALLRGHEPMISRVSHDGKTLFRLRTGGFATHAAARRFCAKVAAKGGSCVMF
jgi:cell division septation protein DedD